MAALVFSILPPAACRPPPALRESFPGSPHSPAIGAVVGAALAVSVNLRQPRSLLAVHAPSLPSASSGHRPQAVSPTASCLTQEPMWLLVLRRSRSSYETRHSGLVDIPRPTALLLFARQVGWPGGYPPVEQGI
ncbi:hypothetical protein BS50DRAFT_584424 [Corynespora cassiicola Philippines]|uniref:Uncharacterized protein n=1 Tax=Corynespora cassiicola Philippines TaxID=1448308 RepID=A0A2T2NZJ4_CORCC|nr:hypothetical protein BS50DRAFT_584424 [Corynespora cassiicola Philippines]